MKKTLIAILSLAALAALFSTCKQAASTTSIDECISSFMSDINSTDRSGVYKNLDSSAAAYNTGAKTSLYWNTFFPTSDISYSLSGKTTAGNYVYATITGTGVVFGSKSIVFVMSEDSDGNAQIRSIAFTSPSAQGVYN